MKRDDHRNAAPGARRAAKNPGQTSESLRNGRRSRRTKPARKSTSAAATSTCRKRGFVSADGQRLRRRRTRAMCYVDESKQADIENLWRLPPRLGRRAIARDFSLTIVLYGRSKSRTGATRGPSSLASSPTPTAACFRRPYNQLNALLRKPCGQNYALNLRKLYLLNTNYADLSFPLYDPSGEKYERASRQRSTWLSSKPTTARLIF